MSDNFLNLSNAISVSILGTPSNLGTPNINTLALFSAEAKPGGWGSDEYKIYTSPSDVGEDFGTSSDAYKIAVAVFSQQPNPLNTGGYLVIVPRTPGSPMETVEAAIARMLDKVFFYGILVDEQYTAEVAAFESLTAYVQTLDKVLFYASDDASELEPGALLDDVRTASKTHTRALFHSVTPNEFAAAYASRMLSVDHGGSLTAHTAHFKTLATIESDPVIDQTKLNKAQSAGVDVYATIGGRPRVFSSGENVFFDSIYNRHWFKFALQTAGFNYLATAGTKVPQTEIGMEGLKSEYRKVCEQAVANGFVAPGAWNSPDYFGDPAALVRNVADYGFYVYSQPVSKQLQADRALRKAPLVQIAIKEAGAVHRSNVIVSVNI